MKLTTISPERKGKTIDDHRRDGQDLFSVSSTIEGFIWVEERYEGGGGLDMWKTQSLLCSELSTFSSK